MAYSPRIVANALLLQARKSTATSGLSHMKLQKLVFFMHAWWVAMNGERLVSEPPQAWQYGPVFESLYHELKPFGSRDITSLIKEYDPTTGGEVAFIPNEADEAFWTLLSNVWDRYGKFSAMQLSALTHETNGPWDITHSANLKVIPDDVIASYYRPQLTAA